MVRALAWLLGALAAAAAVSAQEVPRKPAHRAGVPAVESVDVQENGAWTDDISGDETPEDCARFVLAPEDVREYFRRARLTSQRDFGHELDMSRCHARGSLTFPGGEQAEWFIDRERRGRLALPDGRTLYFHCSACRSPAFGEP